VGSTFNPLAPILAERPKFPSLGPIADIGKIGSLQATMKTFLLLVKTAGHPYHHS
jgi:hypothetical protein